VVRADGTPADAVATEALKRLRSERTPLKASGDRVDFSRARWVPAPRRRRALERRVSGHGPRPVVQGDHCREHPRRLRRQDGTGAEQLYRKALEIDARQPEAQYNLGYVMLERAEPEASIPLFLGAIESDPKFSDAYFNLAMAYEQVGESQKARPFWKNYISLEPTGTWTEIAKRHL
jgi:tetratricopeptide (TPR) repeat protein